MTRVILLIALILLAGNFRRSAAQTPPPATAAAEVTECVQAQMVVDRLLDDANSRIEASRQTNNPADMRAAVDSLQSTLRDVRAQLAPCGKLQPTDLHGPHVMPKPPDTPGTTPAAPVAAPSTPPAADPHADHAATAATSPAKPVRTPGSSAVKPGPAAKPPASDPHAGHGIAAPARKSPAAKPAPSAARPAPKAAATDAHAGHTTAPPAKPQPPAPAESSGPAQAADPVCGLKVDPATSPGASHQGRTYFFCSEQHQQLFQKNPAKYLPRGR